MTKTVEVKKLIRRILKEELSTSGENIMPSPNVSTANTTNRSEEDDEEDEKIINKVMQGDLKIKDAIEIFEIDGREETYAYRTLLSLKRKHGDGYINNPEEEIPNDDNNDDEDGEEDKPKGATLWEKIKYGTSKLGRYKVNGKFFGKNKELKASREKIKAILEKESNKKIKELDDSIKQNDAKFPNSLKGSDFLSSILSISAVYDSIIEATTKTGSDNLPADVANSLINDLREYVKQVLDAELKGTYSTLNESRNNKLNLTKEELRHIDETFGLIKEAVSDADNVRSKLKSDREYNSKNDVDNSDFSSTRMSTLKSNKLPIALIAAGFSASAFSWLVNTDWFKHLFDVTKTTTELVPSIEKSNVFNRINKGDGVYKLLGETTKHKLDGNSNPTEFINSLKEIGGGDAKTGVENLCKPGGVMMNPEDSKKGLLEFLKNPSKFTNMNDLFHGAASGTGKLVPTNTTLYGTIAGRQMQSIITRIVMKQIRKTTVTTGGGIAVWKTLGAWASPIGIGLITAGVLVKLMRVKGQKSSRAATLNLLYQSLRNVPVPKEEEPIIQPEGEVDNKVKPVSIEVPPPTTPSTPTNPEKPKEKGLENPTEPKKPTSKTSKNTTEPKKPKEKGVENPTEPKKPTSKTSKKQIANEDDLYIMLRDLFKEIVKNKKFGGKSTNSKVNTSNKNVRDTVNKIKNQTNADNKEQKGKQPKNKKNDGNNNLTESLLLESITENPQVRQYLTAKLKSDKLKFFENIIQRVEKIIEKIKQTDISKYNNVKIDSNPIMYTNFDILFHKRKGETDDGYKERLVDYINNFIFSIYSTSFKGGENMIDKMTNLGGGDLDLLQEARSNKTSPITNKQNRTRDPQNLKGFRDMLLSFLRNGVLLFQHLYNEKKKRENKK